MKSGKVLEKSTLDIFRRHRPPDDLSDDELIALGLDDNEIDEFDSLAVISMFSSRRQALEFAKKLVALVERRQTV